MNGTRTNKLKSLMLLCMSVIIISSNSVIALAQDINVILPTFDVTINGVKIENQYRKYPFLVYKDITYFPMTYVDSRFLGLETKWHNKTGLEVINTEKVGSYGDFEPDMQLGKNLKQYRASIPNFNIMVNGEAVYNSKETYPIIIFRDVTYFPLTWRFGVDEFGWEYSFTSDVGLKINSFTPPPQNHIIYPLINGNTFEDNVKVEIHHYRIPYPGNLYISIDDGGFKQLGDNNFIYGVIGSKGNGSSMSLQSDDYMEFKEGYLYINAIDYNKAGISNIYKINVATGETNIVE